MDEFRLDDEIRLSKTAVHTLIDAARRHGDPVASCVREAGRAAGESIVQRIVAVIPLAELDLADFWSAVNAESGARGLGTFEWESGFPGHAELVVRGTADSYEFIEEYAPAPFTAGFLEGLLSAVADEPVAVVQAPADGSSASRFLVGAPSALGHVRARLDAGAPLEQALEGL